MSTSLQGVYSPLPQNLSDSDSEKEITMESVCGSYGNNSSNTIHYDGNSFKQNGHNNFHNMSVDSIKIKSIQPKMSTLRKVAFVMSIVLCFLPVVIFLWILPCSDSDTCPIKISNWEYQQEDIELKGKVNLVHGLYKTNLNLAVLYKGNTRPGKMKNGAISLMGSNGAVAWDFHQEPEPIDMDCSIIDADGNGLNDCLILDNKGLKAVETISGTVIWHVHSHESGVAITDLTYPVKLLDFNDDGVSEFLTVFKKNSFLIICGKTGKALRNIKVNCLNISEVKMDRHNLNINYACVNATTTKFYEIPVAQIRDKYTDAKFNVKPNKVFGKEKEEIYVTLNRKLIASNNGKCPSCHSTVSLFDDKEKQLKTWTYPRTYIMKPETFSFQSSTSNLKLLKGHVHGFILKLWKWPEKSFSNKVVYPNKSKRNIPFNNGTYVIYEIIESVILITFNNTDIHVINASLTDINQLCQNLNDENICQPDYINQEESLLVADIDQDKSQELITHTSTYVKIQEENDESWHLISYLKVFRLEDELPKLYNVN